MKSCIMTLCLCLGVSFVVRSAPPTTTKEQADKKTSMTKPKYPPKNKFDMLAFRSTVDAQLREIKPHFKSVGALMKWEGIKMLTKACVLKHFSEHPYIEDATNIRRGWYKKLAEGLIAVSREKTIIEAAEERDMKEEQAAAEQRCVQFAKKLISILKKPEKVKKKPTRRRRTR